MPRATTTFWAMCCTSAPRRFITPATVFPLPVWTRSWPRARSIWHSCRSTVATSSVAAHGILGNFTFDEATALCTPLWNLCHDRVSFRDV